MLIGLGILCAGTGFAAVMYALTGHLWRALASVAVSERRLYASKARALRTMLDRRGAWFGAMWPNPFR